jgi:hypothetical protein
MRLKPNDTTNQIQHSTGTPLDLSPDDHLFDLFLMSIPVNRVLLRVSRYPVFPNERTFPGPVGMSQTGQQPG